MAKRILFTLFLFITALFAPFWFTYFLGAFGIFVFKKYWEILPIFLISDFVFAVPTDRFWGLPYVSFLCAVLLLFSIEVLKTRLRFYQK